MTNQALQRAENPLVSVYCMTYNQENTIAQAIESIVSQKTDFPFELIVHDDASTDATADVVRGYEKRYPEIIRPIYQTENQYRRFNLVKQFIHPASRGKYIAFCEGDDFWSDTDKLQLQADIMRANPECTLCFHAVDQLFSDGRRMNCRPLKKTGEVSSSLVVKRGGLFCSTVSSMYRRDVMDIWPQFRMAADVYDYPSQALAAFMGKVYYIDRNMGVYRFASEGSWTAQHSKTADTAHIENETKWLSLFDDYTAGRFRADIDYHMAHLWLTEYRKNFDKFAKDSAKPYIRRLPTADRALFTALFTAFSVGGKSAEKAFNTVKKFMLK